MLIDKEKEMANLERQEKLCRELMAKRGMNFITALVCAGDLLSAERATEFLKRGEGDAESLLATVGSFSRLQWAHENLPKEKFLTLLPELWSLADPKDGSNWLKIWKEAAGVADLTRDLRMLGSRIPKHCYRGQRRGERFGISWTLDEYVAEKFSVSGGGRGSIRDGVVLRAEFNPKWVIAYISRRGESEIIINPMHLRNVEVAV